MSEQYMLDDVVRELRETLGMIEHADAVVRLRARVAELEAQIEEAMKQAPTHYVIVDEDGEVIASDTRLDALKRRGVCRVGRVAGLYAAPVMRTDCALDINEITKRCSDTVKPRDANNGFGGQNAINSAYNRGRRDVLDALEVLAALYPSKAAQAVPDGYAPNSGDRHIMPDVTPSPNAVLASACSCRDMPSGKKCRHCLEFMASVCAPLAASKAAGGE